MSVDPIREAIEALNRGGTVRHAALVWHGPPGTVCGQCSFYGYGMQYPNNCYRYFVQVREHGAAFPAETPSCQHFRPRSA
jgi:hypothetical protein